MRDEYAGPSMTARDSNGSLDVGKSRVSVSRALVWSRGLGIATCREGDFNSCMQTTTITIRLPLSEKQRAQRLAGARNLSGWARRLILRELQPMKSAGWRAHLAELHK